MNKITQPGGELKEVKGLWFSLSKGNVSFNKDKDEVTVRFFMSYDEWKEIGNYFSQGKRKKMG